MSSYLNETVSNYFDHAPDPESEALMLLHYLMDRFEWAGTVMTRTDVETHMGRELTDEEFDRVTATKPWRDMGSMWLEAEGWEPLYMAVDEAGLTPVDREGT